MNGQAIKNMGCWGAQDGLLSAGEIESLYIAVSFGNVCSALEIGHYCGLSTFVISAALDTRDNEWSLTSIDAHCVDAWVKDSDYTKYLENKKAHFYYYQIHSLVMRSEAITNIDGFDFVFYDGDHADEQMRFTKLVHDSPDVRLFIFDDRDFDVPAKCCEYLIANGWKDESPPLYRGEDDKRDPKTMTLGIFRR